MANDDQKPLSADQFEKAIAALKVEILEQAKQTASQEAIKIADERKPPAGWVEASWRLLWLTPRFFSSGLFFIGLGALVLYIASKDMQTTHSAFTFVLVVLGVAIVLYGTGTQGMGRLESSTNAGKYNVAMAGGAGVLAFAVAWGMINYASQMKSAFRIEKNYVRVLFGPGDDSDFSHYAAHFQIDGVYVPSQRSGMSFEVLVPYVAAERGAALKKADLRNRSSKSNPKQCRGTDGEPEQHGFTDPENNSAVKTILVQLRRMDGSPRDAVLEPVYNEIFFIRINNKNMEGGDGSYDFPKYIELMCVRLKSKTATKNQLQNTGDRAQETAPNAEPLATTPQRVPLGEQS